MGANYGTLSQCGNVTAKDVSGNITIANGNHAEVEQYKTRIIEGIATLDLAPDAMQKVLRVITESGRGTPQGEGEKSPRG